MLRKPCSYWVLKVFYKVVMLFSLFSFLFYINNLLIILSANIESLETRMVKPFLKIYF
nr:MAG TPA: hypothetical protein [Caudoviricetes sp.]